MNSVPLPERRPSFAFAKRHGVLVRQFVDGVADCACREPVSPLAIAELRRYLRRPVKLERVPETQFDMLLRQVYEAGSGTMAAAEMGLDENTDLAHLAQELPEPAS
jgi:general secretion pathway protein E